MAAGTPFSWHRPIRLVTLLAFTIGVGLLLHRLRRTPEQLALTHYVEVELPEVRSLNQAIDERIERLNRAPGLRPEEARALLVSDVIPRLLRLKKGVEQLDTPTIETRTLNREYLALLDRLIDACRKCVQVIDDPKLSTLEGLKTVRARFAEVRAAELTWNEHLREACARHRLAPPGIVGLEPR